MKTLFFFFLYKKNNLIMRLFLFNQHNTNEKNKSSFKKTIFNLISRNNAVPSQSVKVISSPPKPKPTTIHLHWKEECTTESKGCPAYYLTHSYIRSTRANPNQIRLIAASNESNTAVSFCKLVKKRNDAFVWGKQSQLRNEL